MIASEMIEGKLYEVAHPVTGTYGIVRAVVCLATEEESKKWKDSKPKEQRGLVTNYYTEDEYVYVKVVKLPPVTRVCKVNEIWKIGYNVGLREIK